MDKTTQLLKYQDVINDFTKLCELQGIHLSNDNFDYIQRIGVVATYPNILNILNNNVKKDKEGLVSFETLINQFDQNKFSVGYLFSEKYMAMAHPFFRRGYNIFNNFSPRFLDIYWSFKDVTDKYIALDFNHVRINVDNRQYMEFDTWYGAKFNKKIGDIDDGIAKLRPPLDMERSDINFLFGNNYALNVKWYTKNGIKVFQAEEFKTDEVKVNVDGDEYFPAKYIHAEFDLNKGVFRHFDGALHLYTPDEYFLRRDTDFNHNTKHELHLKTLSQKLFKVNSETNVNDWVELTCHFLTGNPLIIEYFEGKLPSNVIDIMEKIRTSRN